MKSLITNIFILILGVISMGFAQEKLQITVTSEKSEFFLGEPVIVYTTVTNDGVEPIRVISDIGPEVDIYHYFITDPTGNTKPFSPIYIEEPNEAKLLNKDESVESAARIFYGANGYYFPVSGDYKVFVRYKGNESNTLILTILSPNTEEEKEQARLVIEHPEVGFFLMIEGSDALKDALAQINILKQKYPNSAISSYMLYAYGKNYSIPKRNFLTKQPRQADLPKAIEILKSIKTNSMQLFYQEKVFTTLSSCLEMVGRTDEAKTVLLEFLKTLDSKQNLQNYYIQMVNEKLKNLK